MKAAKAGHGKLSVLDISSASNRESGGNKPPTEGGVVGTSVGDTVGVAARVDVGEAVGVAARVDVGEAVGVGVAQPMTRGTFSNGQGVGVGHSEGHILSS